MSNLPMKRFGRELRELASREDLAVVFHTGRPTAMTGMDYAFPFRICEKPPQRRWWKVPTDTVFAEASPWQGNFEVKMYGNVEQQQRVQRILDALPITCTVMDREPEPLVYADYSYLFGNEEEGGLIMVLVGLGLAGLIVLGGVLGIVCN